MITNDNLLETVVGHDSALRAIERRHAAEDEAAEAAMQAKIEAEREARADKKARNRLLWTILGTAVAGLALNLAEHIKW